jgi:hypothetical protein
MKKGLSAFVRLQEKVSRGEPDVFYGVLLGDTKDEYHTISVEACDHPTISRYEFAKEDWIIEEAQKEKVLHWFKGGMNYRTKQLIDAEFELDHQKLKMKEDQDFFDMLFTR